jgi:ribosomal protein S18 acetylase RimI-like enzyme
MDGNNSRLTREVSLGYPIASRVELSHSRASSVKHTLNLFVGVYAEAYESEAEKCSYFLPDVFRYRFTRALKRPGFDLVYAVRPNDGIIAFLFGYTLASGATNAETLYSFVSPVSPTDVNGGAVFIEEIVVAAPWRRLGIASLMRDEFLKGRGEGYAMLCVDPRNSNAKAVYDSWKWIELGLVTFPQTPLFKVMGCRIRRPDLDRG